MFVKEFNIPLSGFDAGPTSGTHKSHPLILLCHSWVVEEREKKKEKINEGFMSKIRTRRKYFKGKTGLTSVAK